MPSNHYDVLIAGTGAAGLSLAYAISQSSVLKEKRVLLLDREAKTENDRTWCFWEQGAGAFEDILHRSWKEVQFYGNNFEKTLQLAPYQYKMLRGEDFYRKIWDVLDEMPTMVRELDSVESITEANHMAKVTTAQGKEFTADYVFNSTPFGQPGTQTDKYNYLLQHFKGYEITTKEPLFDPQRPTFMDFRVDQGGANDARFGYILPDNEHEALVEYTVFSPELWEQDEYDRELHGYLKQYLGLEAEDYTVNRVEYGVIPMTDQYFPPSVGDRIVQLGTVGGQTKASTGYTFQRIQQHTQAIMEQWERTGNPVVHPSSWKKRFSFYDAVLLEVMHQNWFNSRDIFTRIFKRNPEERVFRFLDETTSFGEEIAIMNSMPYGPFLRAVGNKLFKYTFR